MQVSDVESQVTITSLIFHSLGMKPSEFAIINTDNADFDIEKN